MFCGAASLAVTSRARTSLETGLIAVFVLHVSRFANSLFVPHAFCLSHLRARQLYRRLCQSGFFFSSMFFKFLSFFSCFLSVFGFYNLCIDKAKQSRSFVYVGLPERSSPVICFYMHLIFKTNIPSAHLNTLIDNFIIRYTLLVPNRMASQCVYVCAGFKVGRVQTCDSADLCVYLISCCLSLPVCSLSSFPDTNKVFSSTQLLLLLFGSFSENPRDGCVRKPQ